MNRTTIPIHEIIVLDRQRVDYGDIADLADSIRRLGLIQPIVINQEKRLIAGGRRYAAHVLLKLNTIDVVYRETLTEDELHELELEENVRRKEMSWQERCLCIDRIHSLKWKRSAVEGSKWGVRETGDLIGLAATRVQYNIEIARKLRAEQQPNGAPIANSRYWACESFQDAWRLRMRDEEELVQRRLAELSAASAQATAGDSVVSDEDSFLSDLMGDSGTDTASAPAPIVYGRSAEEIAALDPQVFVNELMRRVKLDGYNSLNEAEGRALFLANPDNKPEDFEAFHARRKTLVEPWLNIPLTKFIHHGSCIDWMNANPNSVDHIITDPPYGIEMSNLAQEGTGMADIDTVEVEHDVKENESLLAVFLNTAYHTLKENGYLVMWTDQMQWDFLYKQATNAGFKVQRWPLTWVKTHRCMNQAAQFNFTKTTEIAMVMRKGNATLVAPAGECHIIASHDALKEQLGHPFVKPFAVWEFIHNHISYEGQTILEPFAGRGSGVISALRIKRKVIACELNDAHYNALLENLKTQHYLKINPNYKFS